MSPQDAMALERDDVCLYQSQTYRIIVVLARGNLLRLRGKHGNVEVPAAKCLLVYRQDAVPAGFTVGLLNAEEEATIRAVIQERIRKEGKES